MPDPVTADPPPAGPEHLAGSPAVVTLGGRRLPVAPLDDYHEGLLLNCLREQVVQLGRRAGNREYVALMAQAARAGDPRLKRQLAETARLEREGVEQMAMRWSTSLATLRDALALLRTPDGVDDLLWCGLLAAGQRDLARDDVPELGTPQERLQAALAVSRLTWPPADPTDEAIQDLTAKKSDASAGSAACPAETPTPAGAA